MSSCLTQPSRITHCLLAGRPRGGASATNVLEVLKDEVAILGGAGAGRPSMKSDIKRLVKGKGRGNS